MSTMSAFTYSIKTLWRCCFTSIRKIILTVDHPQLLNKQKKTDHGVFLSWILQSEICWFSDQCFFLFSYWHVLPVYPSDCSYTCHLECENHVQLDCNQGNVQKQEAPTDSPCRTYSTAPPVKVGFAIDYHYGRFTDITHKQACKSNHPLELVLKLVLEPGNKME